eukprot:gene7716-13543_t
MTNKKELEEAGIQIITGSRIRSDSNGQSGDLSSPRSSKNKSMIRKISNLGAWRYGVAECGGPCTSFLWGIPFDG